MKKAITTILFSLLLTVQAYAAEPQIQRVTVYCQNSGATFSGTVPRAGITAAGRREDLGKVAALYMVKTLDDGTQTIGDFVGYYTIEDTGSHPRLQCGAIDVFCNTEADCWRWVKEHGDFLYVQILEEGK